MDELLGLPLDQLLPARFRPTHSALMQTFGESGATSRRVGALSPVFGARKNGEEFPIEASISKEDVGGRRFYTAILRDITERVRSEARIRRLDRVRAVMGDINSLIVRVRDRDELFRAACQIAVEKGEFAVAWIGVVEGEGLKLPLSAWAGGREAYRSQVEALLGEQAPAAGWTSGVLRDVEVVVANDFATDPRISLRDEALAAGLRSRVMLPLCIDGRPVAIFTLCSGQAGTFDEDEMRLLRELANDISFALDHIHKSERLDYLAYFDALTGLANRNLFMDRLAQNMNGAALSGRKLALVLIDIERFKNVNDSLGRATGDALLKHVTAWMVGTMDDANLLARIESDHFALILPDAQAEERVARFLENARKDYAEHPFIVDGNELRVVARIAVAMFPDDGDDADTLLAHAESAMKQAKTSGERYVFYTQGMTSRVAGRMELENRLRAAIERDEFVLHYQPKINLRSGLVTGAEALIRWNDPRDGLVAPGTFVPVLEETGLIHEVGRWALQQAVADSLRWHAMGLSCGRIAVNVSPLQLRDRGFVAEIGRVVALGDGVAASLELEITESMIMDNIADNIATLAAVRAMGVTIAIDDFGTGFSSLGYLAKLPVDLLKIDRSFIVEMMASPEGLALVSTIITLAHSLKLKVVAEGVETEEQSRLLCLLNCDEMQGFLYSRPVPADDFEQRFLSR
jgi:diguanylate cyclase (GGDEF)-like protein